MDADSAASRAAEGGNMIIITPPEYYGRKCNVCGEKDACCEINFRNDYNNNGIVVALCRDCVSILSYLTEAYKEETC